MTRYCVGGVGECAYGLGEERSRCSRAGSVECVEVATGGGWGCLWMWFAADERSRNLCGG